MQKSLLVTGLCGLLASILVGVGEYLLHYDPLARFTEGGYLFMTGIPAARSNLGHFIAVFGASLYPVGCYHIYLMLRPAAEKTAFAAFLLGSFGFMVGVVWIGSRASISALVNLPMTPEIEALVALYELRYETLLQTIRITTLLLSIIVIWLSLTGRSHYRRWVAIFNPILIILACFAIYLIAPAVGKHLMPIALNVAFFVFFCASLFHVWRPKDTLQPL